MVASVSALTVNALESRTASAKVRGIRLPFLYWPYTARGLSADLLGLVLAKHELLAGEVNLRELSLNPRACWLLLRGPIAWRCRLTPG